MLVVRYEELLHNTSGVLLRMANFVGIPATPQQIEWSVTVSSADAMRQIEHKKGPGFFEQKYKKVQERKGVQFNFVQGARAGQWSEVYTQADQELFKSYAGPMLKRLGYI